MFLTVEDDTDFSPDNFSFDFGGDLGSADEGSAGVPPGLERRPVRSPKRWRRDASTTAGRMPALQVPTASTADDSEISY